jgi:hypothetical protein
VPHSVVSLIRLQYLERQQEAECLDALRNLLTRNEFAYERRNLTMSGRRRPTGCWWCGAPRAPHEAHCEMAAIMGWATEERADAQRAG